MQERMEAFPYKWWALIGLSFLSFTAFLDFTIVTTALPFIQKELNASVLQLQWVMNIFAMVLCMFMIASGQAGDFFGRKKVFYIGFILFGVAAIGAGCSPTIQWLIFFRAIQGFAAAIIATLGASLLPQAFPPNEQTRAIGIFSAFNGAGLALGPFLGGVLITFFSWRWVFWINIPIIVVALIFCSFSLKPSPRPDHKIIIDWLGLFLLVTGLGSLIYGIIHGEQIGWTVASTWLFMGIGVIALFLLVIVDNKRQHSLLDFSIFSDSHTLLALLVCMTAGFVTFVFMFFDPLYLELIRKQDPLLIGLTLLCVPVMQVLVSLSLQKLIKQFGLYHLLTAGVASALLAALFHLFFMPTTAILFVLITLMLMGYTWGIANAGTIVAVTQSVNPQKVGTAIGTIFTFWNVTGSIFLALTTVVFHWRDQGFISGYHGVALFSAVALFCIFIVTLFQAKR